MIQHDDGTVTLEEDEAIDLQKEIRWVVNSYLKDDPCVGVLIFEDYGRAAGYALLPYSDTRIEEAA